MHNGATQQTKVTLKEQHTQIQPDSHRIHQRLASKNLEYFQWLHMTHYMPLYWYKVSGGLEEFGNDCSTAANPETD